MHHSGYRRLSESASALRSGNLRVPRRPLRITAMGRGNLSRPRLALGPTGDQEVLVTEIAGRGKVVAAAFKVFTSLLGPKKSRPCKHALAAGRQSG